MASPASVLGEGGKSTTESSLSCSFSSSGGDESELEEGRASEHSATEPYMYETVAINESAESDDADSASDELEVEERRHSTDWYVYILIAALVLHYKLSLCMYCRYQCGECEVMPTNQLAVSIHKSFNMMRVTASQDACQAKYVSVL